VKTKYQKTATLVTTPSYYLHFGCLFFKKKSNHSFRSSFFPPRLREKGGTTDDARDARRVFFASFCVVVVVVAPVRSRSFSRREKQRSQKRVVVKRRFDCLPIRPVLRRPPRRRPPRTRPLHVRTADDEIDDIIRVAAATMFGDEIRAVFFSRESVERLGGWIQRRNESVEKLSIESAERDGETGE
jgi:hypothetical protein